jgi:hypothetical protein
MELFIQIRDGNPFEHPILGDNFCQAFPDIDTSNLPPEFARFTRIEVPAISAYEIYEGVSYEWVDGVVSDVHHVRLMTAEEKTTKQETVKAQWADSPGWGSWIFNEEKCVFMPPTPYPEGADYRAYYWDEATVSWLPNAPLA